MKIVHLSSCQEFYGGEVVLANLAVGLAGRGHQVTCVVRPDSALARHLSGHAIETVTLPLVDWFDPGTIRRVRRCLGRLETEILATHLPRDYFIAAVASLGLPLCNIATRHVLKPISWPALKKPFLRRFSTVVAVSEAVAGEVRRTGLVASERVTTVTNGIDVPPAPVPGPDLRALVGVPPEAPVVGFVGRLCAEKGPATLLRAAARVAARQPELRVFLIGAGGKGGEYRRYLERLACDLGLAERVHFFGYLPGAASYSREFEVQVVSSVAEPFGLVTLEAMAAGVPVIATASGGSPEIIRDGVDGFLVAPGDVVALANRLECLLDSAGLRAQLGQRGHRRYRRDYTLEHMISETEAVYQRALAECAPVSRSGGQPPA